MGPIDLLERFFLGLLFGSWALPLQGFNVRSCPFRGERVIAFKILIVLDIQMTTLNVLITILSFWQEDV